MGEIVGMWDDDNCTLPFGYVCKTDASTENVDPPPPPPVCDDVNLSNQGFYKFNGACYKWISEAKPWTEAEQSCKDMNSHLVSIMDSIEQAYVFTTVETDNTWIGLNNREVYYFYCFSKEFDDKKKNHYNCTPIK